MTGDFGVYIPGISPYAGQPTRRERGYEDKVRNAVTLLAAPSLKTDLQLHDRTRTHFESLTREVLDVPYDRSLVSGGPLNYQALQPATREAWLRASAAVMRGL